MPSTNARRNAAVRRKAAYLPPQADGRLREQIKAAELIHQLQDFALGRNGVEMNRDQVRAAAILLHKVIPDMAPVDTQGQGITPVKIEIVRFGQRDPPAVIIDATPLPEGEKAN